jgi:hypothetical protein
MQLSLACSLGLCYSVTLWLAVMYGVKNSLAFPLRRKSQIFVSRSLQLQPYVFTRAILTQEHNQRGNIRLYARKKPTNYADTQVEVTKELERLMAQHDGEEEEDENEENEEEEEEEWESVTVKSSQKEIPIDKEIVKKQVEMLLEILNVQDYGVDVLFCSEQKIRNLNKEWR